MNNEIIQAYAVLEIKPGASPEEVREAYLDLIKVWHPDRFGHAPALQHKAQEKLKEVNGAYQTLRALTRSELNADQGVKRTGAEASGLRIDRFAYYDVFFDELPAPSQFPTSEWGKKRMTDAWLKKFAAFAWEFRALEYFLTDSGCGMQSNVITHTDFGQRKIYLNRSAPVNLKAAIIPLGIFYIRDKLKGTQKGDAEMVRLALKTAGWNGQAGFNNQNYLMSELVLSNRAAEYYLDRTLNKHSEWSTWWTDVSSHFKLKYGQVNGIEEAVVWVGYNMMNDPIRGYSSLFR